MQKYAINQREPHRAPDGSQSITFHCLEKELFQIHHYSLHGMGYLVKNS